MIAVRIVIVLSAIVFVLASGGPAGSSPDYQDSEAKLTHKLLQARQLVGSDGSIPIVATTSPRARAYIRLVPRGMACASEDRFGLLQWHFKYLVRPNGQEVFLGTVCLAPGEADDQPSAPPPPTVAEIRDAVPLPRPHIHTSPIRRGLTGLETWFWCDADTARTVTVGIRGYEVTARAHVTGFEWVTGDGHSYMSETCGTKPDPEGDGYGAAARHTYETKDFYDLELRATWSGSYSFTGHGRSRSGDLGGVTVASTHRYPVWEVRAVLTD